MLGQRVRWRFSERRDASAESGLHPGYDLCIRCTRRMLPPSLGYRAPVSAIAVRIPGKSHAFLLSLPRFLPRSFRPSSAHRPRSLTSPLSVTFLAGRDRINDIYVIVARANFVNPYRSGTRGCLDSATKNESDLAHRGEIAIRIAAALLTLDKRVLSRIGKANFR